jgi:beta-glucanase (GH16 family)
MMVGMSTDRWRHAKISTKKRHDRMLKLAGAVVVLVAASGVTAERLLASATVPGSATPSGELEFNYMPSGSSLNFADWNTFITSNAARGKPWNGNGRGGSTAANDPDYDAEYDLPGQVSQRNGTIILRATKTPTQGVVNGASTLFPFASGVVSTYGKFEFTGGYLQIRAKMPKVPGMWPGLWMLPGPGATDGDNYEIDLFEGGADDGGPGTSWRDMFAWHLHTPSGTVGADTNSKVNLTSKFNTYGLNWIPGVSMTWYLNGKVIGEITSAEASIPDEPMELIMGLQVADPAASYWHSTYTSSVPLNNEMLIASVKVYS